MKRLFVVFFMMVLSTGLIAADNAKTTTIGSVAWNTEENSFPTMKKIATENGKNIMAVFSATWCMPCQMVKKQAFAAPGFTEVAEKINLWYVEETTKKGKELIKAFHVKGFPTFIIFGPDGTELERSDPDRTVAGFLAWVTDVQQGKSMYQLRKKLEQSPDDRDTMLTLANRLEDPQEKISLLQRIDSGHEQDNDPLSQQARELLIATFVAVVSSLENEEEIMAFHSSHRATFERIFEQSFPDGFQYEQKGSAGYESLMIWSLSAGETEKTAVVFRDYLERGKSIPQGAGLFSEMIFAYGATGDQESALKVFALLDGYVELAPDILQARSVLESYLDAATTTVVMLSGEDQNDARTGIARILEGRFDYIKTHDPNNVLAEVATDYLLAMAQEFGFFADRALLILDERIKDEKGLLRLAAISEKAGIIAKAAGTEKAREYLLGCCRDRSLLEGLSPAQEAEFYNTIAWSLYENGFTDDEVLAVAKKSVDISMAADNLDTLASIHAARGEFKTAIKLERKAMKKATSARMKKAFQENIDLWTEQANQ